MTDADGAPLVVQTGPANERDETRVLPMLAARPALTDRDCNVLRTPRVLMGDAGYGFAHVIAAVVAMGIAVLFKPRGRKGAPAASGSGLGRQRYVVERTLAWFGAFRRIRLCYERTGEHFQAFNELAACVICARKLKHARRRF